jgi:AraC-like DNA-binding protein
LCKPYQSGYREEQIKMVRWQITQTLPFPVTVFDACDEDPFFFSKRPMFFQLDSGRYAWRARYLNKFGFWGDWGPDRTFEIKDQRRLPGVVKEIFVSPADAQNRLERISPDQWYRLNVSLDNPGGWSRPFYVLAWLHHRDYTRGNPANKGGFFVPESNYTFNFSTGYYGPGNSYTYRMYEKEEGSLKSRTVLTGAAGRYVNGKKDGFKIDSLNGLIRFPFKLLAAARAGDWILSGYFRDENDNQSNVFYTRISVVPVKTARGPAWILLAAGVLLVAGIFFMAGKMKSKVPVTSHSKEMALILQYVESHLTGDLSSNAVRSALNLPYHRFYRVLKDNNVDSFPQKISQIRIEKAKMLLKSSDKSVTEVGFEVGFTDTSYFIRVFKEIAGLTPAEYRKNP